MGKARRIVYDSSSDEQIAISELVHTLRDRSDNGLGFWIALRELAETAPETRAWPAPQQVTQTAGPIVYYLRFADRVKIGTTTNLKARLEAIPHDELLAIESGGRELERARHTQFATTRVVGEWFADSEELRQHIASLSTS